MNLTELQKTLREIVKNTAQENFNIALENFAAEVPPKTELGDLAFPVAFELAKQYKQQTGEKKNPREIAEILKANLEKEKFRRARRSRRRGLFECFLQPRRFSKQRADGGNFAEVK